MYRENQTWRSCTGTDQAASLVWKERPWARTQCVFCAGVLVAGVTGDRLALPSASCAVAMAGCAHPAAARPIWGAAGGLHGCSLAAWLSAPALWKAVLEMPGRGSWSWAPKGLFLQPVVQLHLQVLVLSRSKGPLWFWVQWVSQRRDSVSSSFMPFLLVHWLIKRSKPTFEGMEFIKPGRVVNNLMFAFSEERQC